MTDQVTVTLGTAEVPCYAQRHAYLSNRLGKLLPSLLERGQAISTDNLLAFAGDSVYDVLCVLIPTLEKRIPRYQFAGFGSQQAYDAGEYDPDLDESPTLPEIREAIKVAIDVNGLDILGKASALIDPALLRAELSVRLAEAMSTETPSSPPTNGASASTPSSTTDQTSTANEASPSGVSTD